MTSKVILIEWRNPKSKYEQDKYGWTEVEGDIAKVFIKKKQPSQELVDTFFHEMTHVFLGFHKKSKRMSDKQEEYLATKVGKVVASLLQ